jgi:CheY-like chemotaxis protein
MTNQQPAQPIPRLAPTGTRPKPSPRRVLVADDDGENVAWMCEALRATGLAVVAAYSGAELAHALIAEGPFDLIITDICMPWAEGTAVVRAARASEIRTPVLFVSGMARPVLAAEVEGLGNARLLRKPIGVSALRAAALDLLTPPSAS